MKKAILIVFALCQFLHASTTTLTGTIKDAQGTGLNGTLVMTLPMPAEDTTTNTAISPGPVSFRLINGVITGNALLYDVANLQPTGLYYIARAYDQAGNLQFYGYYAVTGGSFNLGAAVPTTVTTSNISFVNPVNLNGNNTFTGTNSFTGLTTFSNTATFTASLIQQVSGTGCGKALNLLNVDASPTNPNKYFRINQSTGALEIMSNACSLIASLSDAGVFTASSGFCIGASCITSWPLTIVVPNAGATGTSVNTLTTFSGSPSTAIIQPINHSLGVPVGITIAGAGTTGSATIQLLGQTSCVFDGATTAGDYFASSTTTAGNCTDTGATPGIQSLGRVLSTNGGGGTYSVSLGPVSSSAGFAPLRVVLGANQSPAINTQTIILTQSVTFPSASGIYRADVRYGMYITAGSNTCMGLVVDTTNSRAWAFSQQAANGLGQIGLAASEISSQTYAAGATATFTLQMICNAAGTTVTVNNALFSPSPAEPTFLEVTPILSQ